MAKFPRDPTSAESSARQQSVLANRRPQYTIDITSHLEQFMSRQSDNDNHSNQLNPNNDEYWHSRGEDERPDDWEDQIAQTGDED